jgi:hypothetical protein
MKAIIALAACAGVLGLVGVSDAAQISSPAIFGAYTQTTAHCIVVNGGTSTLTVTVKILNESGGVVTSVTDPLPPGEFGPLSAHISFGVAYACTATAGSVANLRGALSIEETVSDGFGGSYQRPIRSAPLQ